MTLLQTSLLSLSAALFLGCGGENTNSSIVADVTGISINERDISLYSTDLTKKLNATTHYENNTSADATEAVIWSSSNTDDLSISLSKVTAIANGGDSNVTISYLQFSDFQTVHIKELVSINYSELNVSDTSNSQTIYVSGNFENNESNVTMFTNITWTSDENITISESNSTQVTLTLTNRPAMLFGTLFSGTLNQVDFNKTW